MTEVNVVALVKLKPEHVKDAEPFTKECSPPHHKAQK